MDPVQTRLDIYCIAIGGTGMAPLACLLQGAGHRVRGSDGPLYPPMSTLLESANIEVHVGFDPQHLDPAPELVVVGNAVPRSNVEAQAAERLELPLVSMPQALERFFLRGRAPLVVAGTHGKTTTSAMAAWVYRQCGEDPGYLIGGAPVDLPASFAVGSGRRFIVEGDEYNAAYFDRGPKFLHYGAESLILTSVEYDHADLYPDLETLHEAYRALLRSLPESGHLVAYGDDPAVRSVARAAPCRVLFYGLGVENDRAPGAIEARAIGTRVRLRDETLGEVELELSLFGEHNVLNALAVWTMARADGLDPAAVRRGLATFRGVRRRLEEVGRKRGVVVVDDFAHHPTAIESSLRGVRQRYPDRRIVALFEPRSLTAGRKMFFDDYVAAFTQEAGVALLAPLFHAGRLSAEERLDLDALCQALERKGTAASHFSSVEELLAAALAELRAGDVAVTMSSGSFAGLPQRLLAALGG